MPGTPKYKKTKEKTSPDSQPVFKTFEEEMIEENKENYFHQASAQTKEEPKQQLKKHIKKSSVHIIDHQFTRQSTESDQNGVFQPRLSKHSLAIANSLGNPFERLTSKSKSLRKKPRANGYENHSFTPKINNKSTILDQGRKDRSLNRFQELHDQVTSID